MEVKVIKSTMNELPKYETPASVGQDLRADLWQIKEKFLFNSEIIRDEYNIIQNVTIYPGGRALIPTGLQTAFDSDYEAQIRPRSGLALKHGITVCNTPGTIEGDYRADWGVVLLNLGTEPFVIKQGDRIAQVVWNKIERAVWVPVDNLEESERVGGFGSTGTN